MNTSEVATLLGVSTSTIQRWVKQLGLPMEKNERGHYHFQSEDISLLKKIHEQLQKGTLLHDMAPVKEKKITRVGVVKKSENDTVIDDLLTKVKEIEMNLYTKADSVASYQLLQHRREIDDLQEQVKTLSLQLERLQNQLNELDVPKQIEPPTIIDQSALKRKKKSFVSSMFGF